MGSRPGRRAATTGRGDYRYLTQPRGDGTTWYATVEVPRTLRSVLGKKRLVRSLQTTNVDVARAARWGAVKDLKAEITAAGRPKGDQGDPIVQEALEWREHITRADDEDEREVLLDRVIERAEAIDMAIRRPSLHDHDDEAPADKARAFLDLATGRATPLDAFLDRWLNATTYNDKTKQEARQTLQQFADWCAENRRRTFLETVDDRVAADFRDEALVNRGVPWKTANKKLSLLRQYWKWLGNSRGIKGNPWLGKSLPKQKAHRIDPDGPLGPERAFTDDEMSALLGGTPDVDLADMMRIAALSGMRADEIGRLRVKDCRNGCFSVWKGKTDAAVRKVPIHSALREIVERRTKGRSDDGYIFPDFPEGLDGNRTMAVSKRFYTYRRSLKVDDHRPGARRSKVNFHSFRRWFATKAEASGQAPNVIFKVMGWDEKGAAQMLRTYSDAELDDLKRRCVEAVKLPASQA
ncbi:tyrosine-type recombinase/integrase [Rhodoplanes sp. SY1]